MPDKYDADAMFRTLYGERPPKQKHSEEPTLTTDPKSQQIPKGSQAKTQLLQHKAPAQKAQKDGALLHRAYYITQEQDTALGLKHLMCREMDRSAQVRAALELYLAKELREVRSSTILNRGT